MYPHNTQAKPLPQPGRRFAFFMPIAVQKFQICPFPTCGKADFYVNILEKLPRQRQKRNFAALSDSHKLDLKLPHNQTAITPNLFIIPFYFSWIR
jgi:hypothetical protein